MFRLVASVLVLLSLVSIPYAQTKPAASAAPAQAAPVNPNASPEARALLKYLYSISGKYTLTGQHNYPYHGARWTERAYSFTGKYPALYGQDFGFSGGEDKDSIEARPALIEEVKRQYRSGAVVTLTWHEVLPTQDEPVTFLGSVQKKLTDFEWNELTTPGTDLNKRWLAQVDVVAGYLKQLRDARVPVLFRPYHEMNGTWFWWGYRPGPKGSAALYRQIYERLVNYHHLDNLLWLWNVNAPSQNAGPFADYFPGLDCVDVLTVDNYGEFKQQYYDDILALAKGKTIALGEVGGLPDPEIFKAQARWTYFMTWSEWIEEANPIEKVRAVYAMPNMLGRDDQRLSAAMAEIRKASTEPVLEPVTPEASAEAKALLAKLTSASGKSVLAGQVNDVKAVSAATDRVVSVTAKAPLIYAAEMAVTKESGVDVGAARQAIVDEAKRQAVKGAVVSLSWRPARPTDDEPATAESVRGQLTEFEWAELLKGGTQMHKRWDAQVASLAKYLKQLQDANVAVLFRPYPELNTKNAWYGGRKGPQGSAALYRQLFNCLVNHHGLKNIVWVWEAGVPAPDAGWQGEFFPGLNYVDSLAVNLPELNRWFRADNPLKLMATGKPIGVEVSGVPEADVFTAQPAWTYVLLSPSAMNEQALKTLYANPRVSARVEGDGKAVTAK